MGAESSLGDRGSNHERKRTEFVPEEIQDLLNDGLTQAPVTRTIEEATQVMIGVPSEVPPEAALAVREAGLVAAKTSPNKEPIDLIVINDGDEGIAGYFFEEADPFYSRSAGKN